jgi:hypothetical protein
MLEIDPRLILLNAADSVVVARCAIAEGETLQIEAEMIKLKTAITMGHKLARAPMLVGEKVLKHGAPIGSATQQISVGEHVHLHNMKSDYTPTYALTEKGEIA